MRVFLSVIFIALSFQLACAEAPSDIEDSKRAFVVSEFEKFMELELRDCIAGYDAVLYQEKTNLVTPMDIDEADRLIGMMRQALNNKVGKEVSMDTIRETSSFHISGIYLADESGEAHLSYQGKIIESCNRQSLRIFNQLTESEGL